MEKNSKLGLSDDRDETIYHILSECSKLAQKEHKSRHDWIEKVIHKEFFKKFRFNHTAWWFMHKPEFVLKNTTQNSNWFWDTNKSPNPS